MSTNRTHLNRTTCASRLQLLALSGLLLSSVATAGVENSEPVERIIARVGAYPIMISELAAQVQLTAMQTGFQPQSESELREFHEEILRQLVNDKLFLVAAQQDTSLRVTEDEVQEELDRQIDQISSRFPDEQRFLDALSAEGMTLRDLRRKFYPEVESRILKDKFIGRKLSSISVSRQEVTEFYEKFRDSIPDQPAAVRLAHVLLPFTPSAETLDSVRTLANTVRKSATGGADFDALALQYSAPPGGDLGWIKRDDVTEEFGSAAFALQPGQISGVVKSDVGFHLIEVTGRSADSARVSQIFFPTLATAADTVRAHRFADSLKGAIQAGDISFAEAAKEYSTDDQTRRTEGELGWFAYEELPIEFVGAVTPELQADNIVGPLTSNYGLHLVRIIEKQDAQTISLENNYDQLRELARRHKADQLITDFIEERKKDTYVEIRPLY
ncbi:MAG TPA: peptidylprolyl isomerase [candidate division Zixibacteria bacterium]|nr:peptidylprolyl isomerase [candidate division Zixibacteria bacterium]